MSQGTIEKTWSNSGLQFVYWVKISGELVYPHAYDYLLGKIPDQHLYKSFNRNTNCSNVFARVLATPSSKRTKLRKKTLTVKIFNDLINLLLLQYTPTRACTSLQTKVQIWGPSCSWVAVQKGRLLIYIWS